MSDDVEREFAVRPRDARGNERTFLSWILVSLALLLTGLIVVAVDVPVDVGWRLAAGGVLLLVAIAAALQAGMGWRAADRDLRRGIEPPSPRIGTSIGGGVALASLLLLVGWILTA